MELPTIFEYLVVECKNCKNFEYSFYAPTLEKLKGHIVFGLSVRPLQDLLRISFEISYIDSSSKNNLHIFFWLGYLTLWSYASFKGSLNNFVIKISKKLLEL